MTYEQTAYFLNGAYITVICAIAGIIWGGVAYAVGRAIDEALALDLPRLTPPTPPALPVILVPPAAPALATLSIRALKAIAQERHLPRYSTMRKEELVNALS